MISTPDGAGAPHPPVRATLHRTCVRRALLAILIASGGTSARAADLDAAPQALDPVPVAEPVPVAIPVTVAVPVPVLPFLFAPPPPLPSPTLFSSPVALPPPPPHLATARDPGRAEAQYYGYGVRRPAPQPLGFYSRDGLD